MGEILGCAMFLRHLRVRNFRNLASVDLDLSPGVNLFFGPNAQGKTALLEAVGTRTKR